jgi:hypothetical protein
VCPATARPIKTQGQISYSSRPNPELANSLSIPTRVVLVSTGAETSLSAFPTHQFNIYEGKRDKDKASEGEFYNH